MLARLRMLLASALFITPSLFAQELITNGTFESGNTGWQPSGNFYIGALPNPRNGSWYAYVSNPNGTPGNNLYGTLRQTFSIPNNISSATLRFWYSITSTDSTTTGYDFLTVFLEETNTHIRTFSNTTTTSGYQQYTFDLTSFAGRTLTLQFLATTNASAPTVFRIDDVSATYVGVTRPAQPTNLVASGQGHTISLTWQDNATNETGYEVLRGAGGQFFSWKTLPANSTNTQDTEEAAGSTTCYKVLAKNGAGPSDPSNESCATVLDPPVLTSPDNNATLPSGTVTLTWQTALGANAYRIDIGHSCGTADVVNNQSTSQTSYSASLSAGTYMWRVRSQHTSYSGLSDSSTCRAFTVASTPAPVANFTWTPSSPRVNDVVAFTDTSTGSPTSWLWEFGDGDTSVVQHANHTYRSTGTYPVKLTVTNGGGSNTTTRQVTIGTAVVAPVAAFRYAPDAPVPNQTVQFTDTSTNGPTAWTWDFDNNGTADSSAQHPTHAFPSTDTYTVKLTAGNSAGSSSTTNVVTVYATVQPPTADFTFAPSAPLINETVNFTDTTTNSPTAWAWDFDSNGTTDSTLQHPSRTFAAAGTYAVKLTASNSAGSSNKTRNITVTSTVRTPVASFTYAPSSPVAGDVVTFTDTTTNGPTNWSWTFGDNQTSAAQHPTHTYTAPGTYTVTLTASNSAGADSATVQIVIGSRTSTLTASFTASTTTPTVGESVTFTDTSSGGPASWAWTFGDGQSASTRNATHAFATPGTFNVKLLVSNSSGQSTAEKNIQVRAAVTRPTARFTVSAQTAGVNERLVFTDTSTGAPTSWTWTFGDGETATTQQVVHSYKQPGTYRVTLKVRNDAGQDTASADITITAAQVTIIGHVVTLGQIAIRGDGAERAVQAFGRNGTMVKSALIDDAGRFDLKLPPGTYQLQAVIPYRQEFLDTGGTLLHEDRIATAMSAPRTFTTDATEDIALPAPVVLLHGFLSSPTTWNSWIATARAYRPELIVLTPGYAWGDGLEGAAKDVYEHLERSLEDLYVATPAYRIVAHSKGGLVARAFLHNFRGLPVPDHATELVMLGTPNSGTQCILSGHADLDACTIRAANEHYTSFGVLPSSRVHVIAGTNRWFTSIFCADRPTANDGVVAVDSVFTITYGNGTNPRRDVLRGFAVPLNHIELPKTSWLTVYVLDYFGGGNFAACPEPRYEPSPTVACSKDLPPGKYCLEGGGLSSDGRCNLLYAVPSTGVNLSWTVNGSTIHLNGSIGAAQTCGTPASRVSAFTAIDAFQVYRSTTPDVTPSPEQRVASVPGGVTSFSDAAPAGQTVYYLVTAVQSNVESPPSNVISVTTPSTRQRSVRH